MASTSTCSTSISDSHTKNASDSTKALLHWSRSSQPRARRSIQSLNTLLKIFIDQQIDFVIVGGFAGVLHGSSMVTKDLDLCFMLSDEEIQKLRKALKDLHPKLRITPKKLSFLEFPEDTTGLKNLYLETDLGIVDIIREVTGVGDFNRIAAKAVVVDLFKTRVKVMSVDDLIAAKLALGRPKDLAMVKELRLIQERQTGRK